MSDTGTGVVAAASRRGQPPAGEPSAADLEKLAAELVRRLGTAKARFLASLLDERADEAEGGG
jgi:hypothetical protein